MDEPGQFPHRLRGNPDQFLRLRRLVLLWATSLTPLLFWTAGSDMFEMPKQLALKTAAPLAALLLVSGAIPPALAVILTGFLSLGIVSTLLSPLPLYSLFGEYTSYQGWLHWATLSILLAALTAQLGKAGEIRRFLTAAAGSAGIISAYALIQMAGLDPVDWSNGGALFRAFSTAGNPLYLGFLLSAMVPVCLGLSLDSCSRAGRAAWISCGLLVFWGTLSSGSRSASAGALLGVGLLAFFRSGSHASRPFPLKAFFAPLAAMIILGLALLPAERNPVTVLGTRLSQAVHGGDPRPIIWAGAGRLVRERPFFGHGLDTFATLHPRVQSPRLWDELWHASPEKAHNEFVQVAATAGIPAAGLLVWLAAWLCALAWRNRHESLPASAGAGLAAMSVPALFGFTTCGTQSAAVLLAAVLASRPAPGPGVPPLLRKCAAGMLAVSLVINFHFASSLVALNKAVRNGGAGMDKALALPTPWAQNLLQAGDTLERGWFGPVLVAGTAGTRNRLELLSRIYAAALEANPLNAFCHSAVGRTAFRGGNPGEAVTYYRKAVSLAPYDAYLLMEEAQIMASSGKTADALALLESASNMYPRFGEPAGMAGYTLLSQKKPGLAEPWLRKAVDGDWHGNTGAAYAAAVNLTVIYRNSGRWTEAAWAESAAARYAPGNDSRPRLPE